MPADDRYPYGDTARHLEQMTAGVDLEAYKEHSKRAQKLERCINWNGPRLAEQVG